MPEPRREAFDATVQQEGSFTFVAMPFAPRDVWGARPRYPVTGTINGHAVRGTLGAQGQASFLRLSSVWMRATGLEVGATVWVELSSVEPEARP